MLRTLRISFTDARFLVLSESMQRYFLKGAVEDILSCRLKREDYSFPHLKLLKGRKAQASRALRDYVRDEGLLRLNICALRDYSISIWDTALYYEGEPLEGENIITIMRELVEVGWKSLNMKG